MGTRENTSREQFVKSTYIESQPTGNKKEQNTTMTAPKTSPAGPPKPSMRKGPTSGPSSGPASTRSARKKKAVTEREKVVEKPAESIRPQGSTRSLRKKREKEKEEKTGGQMEKEKQETTKANASTRSMRKKKDESIRGKPKASVRKPPASSQASTRSMRKKKEAYEKVDKKKEEPQETANVAEREDFPDIEKKLREFDFYHGFLPREDLQSTLQNPGDYLIRVSEVVEGENKLTREVILSLMPITVDSKLDEDKNRPRNVVIKHVQNMVFCEITRPFDTINDLIAYYKENPGAYSQGTFQLITPILQQPWEFSHADVTIGKVLGEGAFGKVCAGSLKLKDGQTVDVAIKMTKVSAFLSKMKIKEMMNEARFIRNFNHKNVVRLYGVAHDEQPLYILLELVKGGSLQDYLKKAKEEGETVSILERINFCCGAGRGIEYLHQNQCIHRDIAARNCLLSDTVVKITDFGLSRTGPSYKIKGSCKLPVKWLAPETLSTLSFSYATDVYSWGITCYEVFADGAEPFDGVSNAVVKANVLASKFLEMPSMTPEAIKKFLNTFIFVESSRRSSMGMAVAEFERMAVMCENGQLEMGGGAKQKLMKVFKKRSCRDVRNKE